MSTNRLIVSADQGKTKISRHIYGHFAEHLGRCIYEGLWVGPESPIPNTRGFRNDVVAALRALNMPNLRWPGGCFADTYHWTDGVGPREKRPSILNVHWGGTLENNHCGTHEFLDLCEQLSTPTNVCEPYICGNVGSGTVQEMAQWLEYLTMPGQSPMADLRRRNGREQAWPIKYWAVGNENWGCGGNMRAEYYADLYRQYSSYCRNYTPGSKLYKVACGHGFDWNETVLKIAGEFMDGLSLHHYVVPGSGPSKGSATDFTRQEWVTTMQRAWGLRWFLGRNENIMDRYDPDRRIGMIVDEWGTWFDVEPGTNPGHLYQQNTMRDALVASLSLDVFNNLAHRVHMANIAQTVNVLQAMVLTDTSRMLLTPTYHVFEMFKVHQDATLLPSILECPEFGPGAPVLSASVSRDKAGKTHISLSNLQDEDGTEIACELRHLTFGSVTGRLLTSPRMNTSNTFDRPDAIAPTAFVGVRRTSDGLVVSLPPRSVVMLELV